MRHRKHRKRSSFVEKSILVTSFAYLLLLYLTHGKSWIWPLFPIKQLSVMMRPLMKSTLAQIWLTKLIPARLCSTNRGKSCLSTSHRALQRLCSAFIILHLLVHIRISNEFSLLNYVESSPWKKRTKLKKKSIWEIKSCRERYDSFSTPCFDFAAWDFEAENATN